MSKVKATYLQLVGLAQYTCPAIFPEAILKGQVARLTNPKHVQHLKGLKTVMGEDVEKDWFKDVTNDPKYVAHEEKLSAGQSEELPEADDEDDEDDEGGAEGETKADATAAKPAKPAPRASTRRTPAAPKK